VFDASAVPAPWCPGFEPEKYGDTGEDVSGEVTAMANSWQYRYQGTGLPPQRRGIEVRQKGEGLIRYSDYRPMYQHI
jgi:hypothetical protein